MPSQGKQSLLFSAVLVPVALIILGAFALSAAAVFENLRFASGTTQILEFVRQVRSFVNEQKTFSFNLGENVWLAMIRFQQIPRTSLQTNPWGGTIRAIITANTEMSIESDLPSQDCRRMASYLIGRGPQTLGLLSIAAHSNQDTTWSVIYPPPPGGQAPTVKAACGPTSLSRLALVFKIK
ncbi:MAG: hypothetical protein WC464_07305 [Bdellovibrionales bacterium]